MNVHYGANSHGECGATEGDMTLDTATVTCRTCRGWLPIVAPFLRAEPVMPASSRHDCAQIERDNIDLHEALAEAIKRLAPFARDVGTADLREVLDRTSRPETPAARVANLERARDSGETPFLLGRHVSGVQAASDAREPRP